MSVINELVPEFKLKVVELIDSCKKRGIEMRPYCSVRSPQIQGKLWRQSRTREEVKEKIAFLETHHCGFLAGCIKDWGPLSGPKVTGAVPGFSWHQWAEAIDSVWVINGKSEWSTSKLFNGLNGYRVYVEEAKKLGLTPGGLWSSIKDWPHVQLRPETNINKIYTLEEINAEMEKRFGG